MQGEGERWLERGARVGEYTIEDLLGEGGFGAVFRARSDAGITCALKVFKTTAAELTAERLISQQNEIEALLKLDHPSLVQLYGYGFVEGVGFFLAMELVEGETLDVYLERVGSLDTLEAIRLVRKVAEALAHSHARGVLHLDLKPSNIVIADPHEPRIKVLDFGLATLTSNWLPDDTRVTAGTVGYMAPECLRSGRARPDPRMDLYALGTILYELVAGRLPFRGRGQKSLMVQRTVGELVPLREVMPGVVPAVATLVDELLAQDPARRPGNTAQLCTRLKDIYYDTLRGSADDEVSPQSTRSPQSGRGSSLRPPRQSDDVPFVGRERELSLLASRVLGATAHGGAPMVIVGDAGIGKSRLISELLDVVEQDGAAVVIFARCRELSALVPYSPLREALSRVTTSTAKRKGPIASRVQAAITAALDEDPELVSALVPELGKGPIDSETRRSLLRPSSAPRVATLLEKIVRAIAVDVPVLVAIEDLHWGDESTLSVLDILAASLGDAPVLLLGTTRPPARVEWRSVELMDLGPLDREENDRLLHELLGTTDDTLVGAIEGRVPLLGAGNPLFAIQIIRNLELDGFLGRTMFGELGLSPRNLADYRLPPSIADALRRGVDNLSPASLDVLGVAALFGRQFFRSDLNALGLFAPKQIEAAIHEAEQRCLCRSEPKQTTFVHDAVLEQLERRASRADQREHHLRIAKQLERRGVDPGALARHLERGGEMLRAAKAHVSYALIARKTDPIGAGQRLRRAIDLTENIAVSDERDQVLLAATSELARTRHLLGSTDELLKLLSRPTPHTIVAKAEHNAALALVLATRGEFGAAIDRAERVTLTPGKDAAIERHRVFALNVIGRAHAALGRVQEALPALALGCSTAERAGELGELCFTRGLYGVALAEAGDPEGAEREIHAAASLAERLDDPTRLLGAWFAYAALAEARQDWDLGVSSTAQLLAHAEEHKLGGFYLYVGTLYAGRHQFHIGHVERARLLIVNALNLSRIVGTTICRALGQAFLGDVHLVEGRLDEALRCYERAEEQNDSPDRDERATVLALLGRMHATALAKGPAAEVQKLGDEALARINASGQRAMLVSALDRLSEALYDIGNTEASTAAKERLDEVATSLGALSTTFWPRIPDVDTRTPGLDPRSYWRTRQGRPRPSSDWAMPTQPVAPSVLLATRTAAVVQIETTALVPVSRAVTAIAGVAIKERTATRTGLLEALSTVEGFVPTFDAMLDSMFEKKESGT